MRIFYAETGETWRKEEKLEFLRKAETVYGVEWTELSPDARHTWLTDGLFPEFEKFLPLATKEGKTSKKKNVQSIFKLFSLGVATNRDAHVYSFNLDDLKKKVEVFVEKYNQAVDEKKRRNLEVNQIGLLIKAEDQEIKWTRQVKRSLALGTQYEVPGKNSFRKSLYRPFCEKFLFFDSFWNEERYKQYLIFPVEKIEGENLSICVPSAGSRAENWCFISNRIPSLTITSLDGTQCLPFYTYNSSGGKREENITNWALGEFRSKFKNKTI